MGSVRELRRSLLEDHARRRDGYGAPGGDLIGHLRSDTCGDEVTVRVAVSDDAISALGWEGIGCQICTASAAILSGFAPGLRVADLPAAVAVIERVLASDGEADLTDEIAELGFLGGDAEDLESLAGIARYPLRAKCALLPWRALTVAVEAS
ncbi:iron-sulfur cluster assembly scaffold protein [Amnibacterium flavum]|uniref:NIF system FeS cluster assembly NifU N-terminal domain-containing protein n=1 Tax=Amnibacterium flavum TaxID=2173173 RepID=A0A2V1HWQ0_9MICO|nr:iron-sulfur cluster assembly scaffold protein [Amnibacterium flavum]PVZ95649.1 hypothetical protein DDQ50_03975 [Amnibacterium flavum]